MIYFISLLVMLVKQSHSLSEVYIGDEWKRTSIGNGTFIDWFHPLGSGSVTTLESVQIIYTFQCLAIKIKSTNTPK